MNKTILHIETSTNVCSVALSNNSKLIFNISEDSGMKHAEKLSPFVAEALKELKKQNLQLDAVAVSSGPGSYTGLRIGVSTAKGLCYGFNIPLLAIDTLDVLAYPMMNQKRDENVLFSPMLDARRMEVYTKILTPKFETLLETTPKIIDENSYRDFLQENKIYFFGNGANKCQETITHSNAIFVDDVKPLAENMIVLAEQKMQQENFEDLAYFEPFYLKEFQTTTPKRKV